MIKWTPQKLGIRLHCCVCQISTDKQREGLTIQSEGGVNGERGGWSLVSVVNRGTGAERRENNSCGQDGIVLESEPYTGRSLASTSLLSPSLRAAASWIHGSNSCLTSKHHTSHNKPSQRPAASCRNTATPSLFTCAAWPAWWADTVQTLGGEFHGCTDWEITCITQN